MTPYKFSSLARPLDFKYRTNLAVVLIVVTTIFSYSFFHDQDGINLGDRLITGLILAFNLFIGWALARELDPDEPYAGFLAMALIICAYLFDLYAGTAFLLLLLLLMLQRITNRVTGLPAKWVDTIFVVILAGYLSFTINWTVGLIAGLALWIDFKSPAPHIRHGWASIVIFLVSIVALVLDPMPVTFAINNIYLVAGSLIIFIPYIIFSVPVVSLTDATGEKISNKRIQLTQILSLFTLIMFIFWQGLGGFLLLMPLWATMLALCFFRVYRLIINLVK
jgi:hypothetical protein